MIVVFLQRQQQGKAVCFYCCYDDDSLENRPYINDMEIPKPLPEAIVTNQTASKKANLKNQGSHGGKQLPSNTKSSSISTGLNNQAFTCDIHSQPMGSKSTGQCSSKDRGTLDALREGEDVDLINNVLHGKTKCRFYCCDSCNRTNKGNNQSECEKCEKCQRCEQQRGDTVAV